MSDKPPIHPIGEVSNPKSFPPGNTPSPPTSHPITPPGAPAPPPSFQPAKLPPETVTLQHVTADPKGTAAETWVFTLTRQAPNWAWVLQSAVKQ